MRHIILFTSLSLIAQLVVAQSPAWSRGIQDLSITYDVCMRQAEKTLQDEAYTIEAKGTGYVAGYKGIFSVVITCNECPAGQTLVNIFVATGDPQRIGSVAGDERRRLQKVMEEAVIVSASSLSFSPDITIGYVSWDGKKWAAQLKDGVFLHAYEGNWATAHLDPIINYVSWDGAKWTAKIEGNAFLHAPEGDWARAHRDTILNYMSWDNEKLTISIR